MADRLFVNGKVFTGKSEDDFVTAFRVTDGTFSWVGGRLDETGRPVEQPVDNPQAEVIDLAGRTVVPGLLDVHHHPTFLAHHGPETCLLPPSIETIDDLIELLRTEHVTGDGAGDDKDGESDGDWILAWGYDEAALAEKRQLTRDDLDKVSDTRPVLVRRFCAHSASCNSGALRLAGITKDTPDPAGGRFGRDDDGEPNGMLIDIGAVQAVEAALPPLSPEKLASELVTVGEHLASLGIVGTTDMAATMVADPLPAVRSAVEQGYAQRIDLYLEWSKIRGNPPQLTDDDRSGRARVAGAKVFMDGVITDRTAWMTRAFRDTPDSFGGPTCTDDDLRGALVWARENRVQLSVHAMGDAAIDHVIDVLGDEEPWLGETPSVRIEHATVLTEELTRRLAESRMSFGVISHSIFYFAEFEAYSEVLTTRHLVDTYPLRRLYEQVPAAALSSDCPATVLRDSDNVFTSVQAAVDRRALGGESLGYDEALTVGQALLLYTSRAARCAGFNGMGEITPGRAADFVVLDSDPFTVAAADIGQVGVTETYIGGRKVYSA
ncbi:MAG: amidohydrolase [Dermatophilus congolensis]|nr:amidohydrolase [Dermatophilus congolensis]